jgi:putative transcriptional regulator
MKEEDFNNLVKSIKQAGEIKKGKIAPSRKFEFSPLYIKAIRDKAAKISK